MVKLKKYSTFNSEHPMKTDIKTQMAAQPADEMLTELEAKRLVFEAVDASSDEQYYTCGIWTTLKAAIEVFKSRGDNYPGEDTADGVKIIEIRERNLGVLDWSETGKVVAKFVWRKDYRESDDSYEWRLRMISLSTDYADSHRFNLRPSVKSAGALTGGSPP